MKNKSGASSEVNSNLKGGTRSKTGEIAGTLEEILLSGLKKDGVPVKKVSPDIFPTVIWSDPNENSELDDELQSIIKKIIK